MRRILVPVLAGFLLCAGPVAFARNAGGGPNHSGGMSAGHISNSGIRNSNGVTRADRDKGLDRATERRSDSALEHSNALDVHQGKGRDGGRGCGRKK